MRLVQLGHSPHTRLGDSSDTVTLVSSINVQFHHAQPGSRVAGIKRSREVEVVIGMVAIDSDSSELAETRRLVPESHNPVPRCGSAISRPRQTSRRRWGGGGGGRGIRSSKAVPRVAAPLPTASSHSAGSLVALCLASVMPDSYGRCKVVCLSFVRLPFTVGGAMPMILEQGRELPLCARRLGLYWVKGRFG
jgi:hypothetical protein